MAVKDFFDNLNGGARWDVGVSINRSNSLPLDANSVFASLEDAQNYAKGTPAEGTLANAYPGQVLAVVTDAETIIYYIDANMTLQPVGNTKEVMAYIGDIPETSDAKTIVEYINSKTEGIATTDSLAQLQKDVQALATTVNGKDAVGEEGAEGYEPAVVGLVDEVAGIKATIGTEAIGTEGEEGYEPATGLEKKIADEIAAREAGDKANADDIDALELIINGREAAEGVEAVIGLTTLVADNAQDITDINAKIGTVVENQTLVDMIEAVDQKFSSETNVSTFNNDAKYQTDTEVLATVEAAIAGINHAVFEKVDAVPAVENAADNVLYLVPNADGTHHDIYVKIGEEMVLIDDTDADLSGYVTKETEKSLVSDSEIEKLSHVSPEAKKVEKSDINGNIKIDGEETVVYTHPTSHEISEITGLQDTLDNKVAKEDGKGLSTNDLTDALKENYDAAYAHSQDEHAPVDAEKNVIASVDEVQFAIDADRKLTLLDVAQDKISGLTNAAGNEITLAELLASKVDKKSSQVTVKDDEGNETTETVEWTLLSPENQNKLAALVIDKDGQVGVSGTISAENVTGLDALLNEKVDKVEGMGLSANNFTDTLLEKLNGINAGAQVNVIEGIKFNGATVTVGEDKIADITYTLPIADTDTLGGVKSVEAIIGEDGEISNASAIENKIAVAEDGTMEVNSLNVNKLVQTDGEFLIMNGGSASV